jgi:U3 small nucleolar RNA-associated protein 23
VITQCSIAELYANADPAPIAIAKTCERRRCGHIPDALTSHDCLTACVNVAGVNKHRYILATQDERLRGSMRMIPGVPMVYIRRAVMIMEPPSPASLEMRDVVERQKLGGRVLGKRKREDEGTVKKKKGPKEPNPLSVKKKKKSVKGGMVETAVEEGNEIVAGDAESNVVGDINDSTGRQKSTRRRRHHKHNPQSEISVS